MEKEKKLQEFTTKEIVEELRCREINIKTVGPAIIIEVID